MVTQKTNGEPRNRQVPPKKPTARLALDDSAAGACSDRSHPPDQQAVGLEDADGEVAQAGHGPGGVADADLGGVLGEGGVAEVVQRLDAPAWVAWGNPRPVTVVTCRRRISQDVGGASMGDQPIGVGVLGRHGAGSDHPPSQVQALQEWLEPGDLVDGGGHVGLGQDRPGRWWVGWWLLDGQPGADGTVQRVGVDAGRHPGHGGLAGGPDWSWAWIPTSRKKPGRSNSFAISPEGVDIPVWRPSSRPPP